jgi:hypothetical protein
MPNYHLHFIGARLYDKQAFEKESHRLGVNRAFPPQVIKNMQWGDRILLAQYEAVNTVSQITNLVCDRWGRANVFGYYVFDGMNLDAPDDIRQEVIKRLAVVETIDRSETVDRACGSYSIGASHCVTDTVKEIMVKLEEACKEKNFEGKIKVFVSGRYYPITPTVIEPVHFSRAGLTVELAEDITAPIQDKNAVRFIVNYSQRRYTKKKKKEQAGVVQKSIEGFPDVNYGNGDGY